MALTSSTGLILAGAASASATSGGGHDEHGKKFGWVNVCQDIRKDDHGKGRDDDRKFRRQYKVRDSYGDVTKFWLQGRYDCYQVKVHEGWVNVKVVYKPDYTRLKGYDEQKVYVKKGRYEKVTFKYEAKKNKGYGAAA